VRRAMILVAAASAIFVAYLVTLTYAIAYAAMRPTPAWWRGLYTVQRTADLSWILGANAIAVLLASLPIAIVVAMAFRHLALPVAWTIGVLILFTLGLSSFDGFGGLSTLNRGVAVLTALEFLASLPVIVWLLQRLPSNYAFERPGRERWPAAQRGR
jgi:hypothetical protein